jgi:hypothetical protein
MAAIRRVASVIVLALLAGLACSCDSNKNAADKLDPEVAKDLKGLHVWCPHCRKTYVVVKEQTDRVPGTEPIFIKALKVPCPTCKKADGQETIRCVHCDGYVPVAVKRGARELRKCPKCGKYPYGAGPSGTPANMPPP